MRALIVDTNPEDIENITKSLSAEHSGVIVSGICSTIQAVFEWLNSNGQPDILFMDICLSEGLSFEILNYLESSVQVIFTFSCNKSISEIFENLSISFLPKPFVSEHMTMALKRKHHPVNRIELYESLLGLYFPRPCKKSLRRIIVKKGFEFHIVCVRDIVYFTCDNGILFLVTKENHKHLISGTLQDITGQLENNFFYRANRNFIINSDFIKGYRKIGNRINLIFSVTVRDEIYVNNYRVTEFKNWLSVVQTDLQPEL
jgi:DNA-binding LytR/AlgR family response regulator